jgi:integrase/recombinase XerC
VIPEAERFLDYLRSERGLSPRTQAAYRRDLKSFSDELARLGIDDSGRVSEHEVRRFIARRHRQGLSPRSIQRLLSAVRSFYRWSMREGLAEHNPAAPVRAPRAGRKLPGTLDTDAIARLLDIPDESPLAIRDKAIMELFYSSGLRLAELASLRWDQVDTAAGLVTVTGKGNKTRVVPLGSYAAAALGTWRKARGNFAGFEEPCIFVSSRGKPISTRAIQSRIASVSPPAPAQLRQPPAGVIGRPARGAGIAGPCRYLDHPNLHPPRLSAPRECLRQGPPPSEEIVGADCRSGFCGRSGICGSGFSRDNHGVQIPLKKAACRSGFSRD